MPVIFTVTFNPCIDENISVDVLRPDIKLRCNEPLVQPGGGGINVARAITGLGGHATALFPYGGANGRRLKDLLSGEQITFESMAILENTRANIIITERSTGQQYKLNMPGPQLNDAACKGLLHVLEEQPRIDYLVVSGSLAPGVSPDIFQELKTIAFRKGAMLVVDTSGEALKKAVGCGADLVKLSVHELSSLTDVEELVSMAEIEAAARRLSAGGVKSVVVSMGSDGAFWVSGGQSGHIAAPAVKTVSTVGAGDSMVAGIVLSLSMGKPLSQAVKFGVACGSAATMHPGTTLCKKEDVETIMQRMNDKIDMHEKDTGHRGRA